jgi:hypothetical protein
VDDIFDRLYAVLLSFLGKTADVVAEIMDAAGRKALEIGASAAGKIEVLAAKMAAVPLWVSLPAGLVCAAVVAAYFMRQRLYDRVLVYHLVWLKRRGYARRRFTVRRGAVHESLEVMARPVALPGRFAALALFEVHPDRYLVVYGPGAEAAEAMGLYRRDTRAGLSGMGSDIIVYFRKNSRMLHADSELRALFAALDAHDPAFAANRPLLPGEPSGRAACGMEPQAARKLALDGLKG